MERLQKVIAESGYTSRRKAEELIAKGKVFVNGHKITEMGYKVSGDDEITVNGTQLKKENKVYYLLYKPSGIVCTTSDEKGRMCVTDLIEDNKRVYPIGRLDYDTTGLLLLTNDGELANVLMHPSHHVEKTYIAKLDNYLNPADLMKLKSGIDIDGTVCKPTRVKLRDNSKKRNSSSVEITIVEGRNHIVKRVFKEIGYKVVKLTRTTYAFLNLEGLRNGEYRALTIKEVKKLYEYKK